MGNMRNALMMVTLAGAMTAPPLAGAQVYVRVGPPRPLYERPPLPPRPGWVWRPGYHRWDGVRYVWVPGAYLAPPRPRAYWVPGRWVAGPRGWFWREGYWR